MSSGTIADACRAENEPRKPHIIEVLDKHSIGQYAKKHPEQLTQQRIDSGDVTICMNQRVIDECMEIVSLRPDTTVWDVDDNNEGKRIITPGDDLYKYTEEIYEQLVDHINKLKPRLEPH